jgi:hypothetical protein
MDRKVTAVAKDRSGKVTALCNPGQSWSPRRVQDVLKDIRAGRKSYYVEQVPRRSYLRAIAGGKLETSATAASKNRLDCLPTS